MKKLIIMVLVLVLGIGIPCVAASAPAEEATNWEEFLEDLPQDLEALEKAFEEPRKPMRLNEEDSIWFRQRMNQMLLETGLSGFRDARLFCLPYNGKIVIAYRAITGDGELYIDGSLAREFYSKNWSRFLPELPQDIEALEEAFEAPTQPLTGEAGRWFRQHLSQLKLATGLAGFQQIRLFRIDGEVVIAYRAVGGDGTVGALYINSVPAEVYYNH